MQPQNNDRYDQTPGSLQGRPGSVSDDTVVQSYASGVMQDNRLESLEEPLEVHGVDTPRAQFSAPQPRIKFGAFFSRRKAMVVSTLITLVVLALTVGAMSLLVRQGPDDKKQNSAAVPEQRDVKIEGSVSSNVPEELQGAQQSLLVNGDVITRGSLRISNGGYVSVIRVQNPNANQTLTLPSGSGTICLDSNNCGYAGLNELNALQGDVNALNSLLSELENRTPPAGVDTLNGQRGAVSIQGSLNRINVSTTGGAVTLTTPQDLDANANVQFGSLTVSSTGQIRANTLVQTGAGNSININANNDMITFTAGGRVFQLPNSGGATQTICTSGASCAVGGGTAVLLADGAAQQDSNANASIYINDTGGGNLIQLQSGGIDRLSVANNGNTTIGGSLTVSGLGNGFVRSTAGALSVVSAVNLASSDVTGTLTVTNGGTGLNTIPLNSVLIGNGTSPVSTVSAGGAGLCLVSTAGAPSFQACPGVGSSFNLAADSGAPEQVNDSDTVTIAGGNNVTTSVGPTDTVTVGTVNNPNFTTSVTTPLLQSSGALSITPGGALTVGATGQSALLQGSVTTITSSGAGNDIILTPADSVRISTLDCTGFANGGVLTTDATGSISCADDNGDAATGITGTGSPNRISLFTGAQTVGDSWLLQNGSTLELDNTRNLSLTGGNFSVTGSGTFSGLLTANGDLTVQTGDTFTFNGEAFTDLTGTGLTFNSGSLQTTLGTSIDLTSEVTGILPVANGGTGVNGSTAANGQLLVGNGTGYTLATLSQGSGITITNGAGSITVANTLGATIESVEITDLTVSNADIANGTIDLSTKTSGNYVATIADSGSGVISVTGSGSNNAAVTLGLVADSVGDTQLAFNTGQHLTTASAPSFAGLTITGGTFTVGTTSQLASLVLHDGNGQSTTLRPGDSAGNLTFVLPVADGSANQCIKTNASGVLSFGDCVASIGGGGGITGSGTQNRLSKFGAGGGSIGDSTITDDGTNVTTSVDLIVQGGAITMGTALQDAALTLYGNGFTADIGTSLLTANSTFNLPAGTGGEFCIKEVGNCSGSGGGNAPQGAQYLTLALDAGLSAERTLSFNGTNFSVVDNGANNSYTVNTAQNINTAAAPSFAGLTLTGNLQLNANTLQGGAAVIDFTSFDVAGNGNVTAGTYNGQTISNTASLTGTLAVAGLATLNGGLTVETGDTITFNGDAFTDFTGNGLQVTSNALTILAQSNKGLEVDGNGLSLIDCSSGQILKYNGSNQWVCDADAGGSGVGDDVQVNGVDANGANFANTAASGTTASITWSLNNVANPDEITLTVGTASATEAGVVTTGNQTFAGNKTFNGSVVLAASQTITVTGGNTGSRPAGTEGTVYYDTDTDRLMVYSNGKWQADRSDAILVAASNSSQADKDAADYVADGDTGSAGDGDQVQINQALTAASGKKVVLLAGTYVADATILVPNNTTLTGVGRGTLIELADLDAADNLIENSDTTTGTGVTVRDMRLDGRKDLNTAGTQRGISFTAMGGGTGSSARQGAHLTGLAVANFRSENLFFTNSGNNEISNIVSQASSTDGLQLGTGSNNNVVNGSKFQGNSGNGILVNGGSGGNTVSGNHAQGNGSGGFTFSNSSSNTITGNTSNGNQDGFNFSTNASSNTVSSNTAQSNSDDGFDTSSGSSGNTFTGNTAISNTGNGFEIAAGGNTITGGVAQSNARGIDVTALNVSISGNQINTNTTAGVYLNGANNVSVTGNRFTDNGGGTNNNAIYLVTADTANITGNQITDAFASGTNYAINITNNTSDANYLADNSLGGGTIYDDGTGTILSNNILGGGTIAGTDASRVYNGQTNSSSNYLIQPAGTIELAKNTNVTGTLNITSDVDTNGSLTVGNANQFVISNTGVVTSGTWQGTAIVDTYVVDSLTISSAGTVDWQALSNYPAACPAGQAITQLGDSVTCTTFAAGSGSGNYIQNQNASAQTSANFWIDGDGTVDGTVSAGDVNVTNDVYVNGQVQTNLIDAAGTSDINIGGTNATGISLDENTTVTGTLTVSGNTTVAAGFSLRVVGGNTVSRPGSPSEGTIYYDTDTKQLLTYANGKWQADRTDTLLVAASNSSQTDKDRADYVADGNTGAAADGDQVQVNAALTAASGKKVVLLAGTYTLDASISVPNNTILSGVGPGTLITIPNALNSNFNAIANSDTSTGTGVTVQDLRLDGNKANQSGSIGMSGVALIGMGNGSTRTGAKVQNVQSNNWYWSATGGTNCNYGLGICLSNSSNNTIVGNTTRDNTNYGIYVEVTAENNIISNNVSQGHTQAGIMLLSDGNNVTGNTTESNQRGIEIDSSNNTVTGNTSRLNTTSGIYVFGGHNNTVTGNIVTGNSNNGISLTFSDGNLVSSNKIHDNGGAATNNGVILADSDNNSVTSNSISDTSCGTGAANCYAINISNAASDNNHVASNDISDTDGDATTTINNQGTGTKFGGQVRDAGNGNHHIQPAGTIELVANTNVTGTLNVSGNFDTNGSLTVGNANQFVINNTGVVTSGTWQAGTIGLLYGGTNNTSYTTNGIVYSNGTSLVSTGAGTTGQCLLATTGSAPTWASCTATTLQGAYDASSVAPTPATITLTDNKNLQFVAADTGTDPSIIMKLNCTACGTGATGNFLVQNNGGAALFSIAGNGDIQLGTAANGISISSAVNSGAFTLSGTAQNTKRIRLLAEYPSAVLNAVGGSNTGTMTSGYDVGSRMNYYKWTTTQPTNQNYDIVVQVPVPTDFASWANSGQITVSGQTSDTTNGTIGLTVIDTAGATICNNVNVTPGSTGVWPAPSTACSLSSGTYTVGDYITLRIRLQAPTSGDTRVGNIFIDYKSKF